jgi:hypothetical protein
VGCSPEAAISPARSAESHSVLPWISSRPVFAHLVEAPFAEATDGEQIIDALESAASAALMLTGCGGGFFVVADAAAVRSNAESNDRIAILRR